jgi:hypothetical protein
MGTGDIIFLSVVGVATVAIILSYLVPTKKHRKRGLGGDSGDRTQGGSDGFFGGDGGSDD